MALIYICFRLFIATARKASVMGTTAAVVARVYHALTFVPVRQAARTKTST